MPIVLAFNPGSNSLKFDLVAVTADQHCAADGKKLLSGSVDNLGKPTKLVLVQGGKAVGEREGDFRDFPAATERVLEALVSHAFPDVPRLKDIDLAAVRAVHGGDTYKAAVRVDDAVRAEIRKREPLAPLHNRNSLSIIDVLRNKDVLREKAGGLPVAVAFDTAFHRTMPEYAWRYPIERELADRHGIRRFGFHGLSHRYMLERYAQLVSKPASEISIVTLHLESGCSAAAIRNGESVDTSMGLTPLEGLMMGTRSGSVDPAVVPLLMREAGMGVEQAMEVLEKKSGLLGVSGVSLDTRELRKREDEASRLALKMFGYRARLFTGAYLAALGEAQAVIFGGGIGENTPEIRTEICDGLRGWGLRVDAELNQQTVDGDVRISSDGSRLEAWVIHVEEGMQLAQECARV